MPGTWPGKTPSVRFCCMLRPALPAPFCCWARSSFWSPCSPSLRSAQANTDEPLGNPTAPRLVGLSTGAGDGNVGAISGPVVVEAYINDEGEVYDYRIVSGPNDAATQRQVENMLLFSVFEPARFFGQPVRGLAVLSFSGVSVRG